MILHVIIKALALGREHFERHPPTQGRARGDVPKLQDVSMGEWRDLEFGTPREHVERKSRRNTRARDMTRWSAMDLTALRNEAES